MLGELRDLPQFAGILCFNCLDTGIEVELFGPRLCGKCQALARADLKCEAHRFADTVLFRLNRSMATDAQTLNIGRMLVHATPANPLARKTLEAVLCLDERTVKGIIEQLRSDWILPIGSSRTQPNGFYWISKPADFLAWSRAYRAQAITSLATLYRLQRAHFPELYGQTDFGFLNTIQDELQEAI